VISVWIAYTVLAGFVFVAQARADAPNKVGLVVSHDGKVIKKCIEFSEPEISGLAVLERSGLDLNYSAYSGMGAGVCRIDNVGCTAPQQDCFCQCQGTPCLYWSYWHLTNGSWEYSNLGASNYSVSHGDMQGWMWGEGTPESAGEPPLATFKEICGELAEEEPDTPPAQPTDTPTAGSTDPSAPTNTPPPTDTPRPGEAPDLPTITHFTADRTSINAGESVTLSWDLHDAQGAYLKVEGVEEGVVAPGSKTVAPTTTTVYTLIARNDGGEVSEEMTIIVNPGAATPLPTDTPPPTHTPVPVDTSAQGDTAPPTPADTPVPLDTPLPTPLPPTPPPLAMATNTPLPPPTATPMPVITLTPTPAAVAAATSAPALRKLTPGALVRDRSGQAGPATPMMVLVVVGAVSVVGGLGGILAIVWSTRQRRPRP
jgi:hypothetical protein